VFFFYGVHAYTVAISYCRSTWKNYILVNYCI